QADQRSKWSDDLTRVTARSAKLALVGPLVASPVVTQAYQGKEARQTQVLKAPAGAYLDESDTAFCASGKATKEGRWWTAQWWIKCN
ncbi:MAG TPA: hypothetical protein VNT01_03000, partial [Symbiobacteriaceae bacterium]|nr:hypothetical protein [Symbiobacteriaceae bacterium]